MRPAGPLPNTGVAEKEHDASLGAILHGSDVSQQRSWRFGVLDMRAGFYGLPTAKPGAAARANQDRSGSEPLGGNGGDVPAATV
jgi:hypothetical protein